ncbi:MAG: L,D-transpeptidase/peptidoglycan binding protein [Lachnospiraceae bacterium]|nr:L,D-transpeptidase/peptidoglycan binding protein [Lachnospiraceae bacterium]
MLKKILFFVFIAISLIYLGFTAFFISHFQFNSSVNGIDVSGKSNQAVEDDLREESSHYSLAVKGRDEKSDLITADSIGLEPVFDGSIGDLIVDQNAFLWPISIVKKSEYESLNVASFDAALLRSVVDNLSIFRGMKAPKDAYLGDYDADSNSYLIVPEYEGTTLDKEKVYIAISDAVNSLSSEIDLDASGCYIKPDIASTDPSLTSLANNLNKYVNVKLVYNFGETSEVLDGATIKDWLEIDGTSVSLNKTYASDFVKSMAKKHDTFGITREFKKTGGGTIKVSGGNYGWWMDRPSTTDELLAAINEGKSGEMVPVYRAEGKSYGSNDVGNSYVEIDLDNQRVYVYKNGGLVVTSDCVSGKVKAGNFTPDGTYAITYKEKDAVLVGENYRSPVSYWMPFNGNIGMHDATWRSSFGGNIYVSSGSHGCVNLPKAKAKTIFETIDKGWPVVVYGGKQTAPASEPKPAETPKTDDTTATETPTLSPEEAAQQQLMQIMLQQQMAALAAQQAAAAQAAQAAQVPPAQ